MKEYKGFKYKLNPDKEQEQLLLQHGGNTRFVWNLFLQQNIEYYEKEKKFIFFHELANSLPELKQEYDFLQESFSQSLQQVAKQFDRTLQDSYKTKKGFPRFKRKHLLTDSFTIPQHWKLKQGYVVIPKIGKVKWFKHRNLEGTPKSITITQDGNKWYCSVLCEVEIEEQEMKLDNVIGIDVGLKEFAVFSDGVVISNPKHLYQYENKLAKAQRKLSRRQEGSKNRFKQRMKVRNIHTKIRNTRLDFLHKTINSITKNYDGVVSEDLNIKGMMKNRRLTKAISDVSWFEFKRQLEYKCKWKSKHFFEIGRFIPTTKKCSRCGHIQEMPLSKRIFKCENCGLEMDRDLNSSICILLEGLKDLNKADLNTVGPTEIDACGEKSSGFEVVFQDEINLIETRKRTLLSTMFLTQ